MFQTFISRHNSNFFSDKLVLTSVTPASSAPVLQTPKATSSTLYFDSLTVNAGNGGFLHCIQMDTSVNAANQVVSVGADIALDRKSGSAGMPRPISYAVFCLKKKIFILFIDHPIYDIQFSLTIIRGNIFLLNFPDCSQFTISFCT